METKLGLKYALLVVGTFLFNYLFWKEGYGINVFLYTIFILFSISLLGIVSLKNKTGITIIISLLFTSSAIVIHSSSFTIVMYYITFLFLVGWLHETQLRSLFYIIASTVLSLFKFPRLIVRKLPIDAKHKKKVLIVFKVLKLSLIPVVILWIFYLIFINANPVFEHLANKALIFINNAITALFEAVSVLRILFIVLGMIISGWFIFYTNQNSLFRNESKYSNVLKRIRVIKRLFTNPETVRNLKERAPVIYRKKFALSLKLKNECISALVLLILVNVLLLIVNLIDLKWVWFGFKYTEGFNLKQFVHEGTYLLILSILLSMAIMLYFFRRNLNFYSKASPIKLLSYVWIGQNVILAISVAIRNFHYITYWGLAYKRIGVILFLIAVAFGLYTLYLKIRYTKTTFFLLKSNSMSIFVILVIASLLNWDTIISKHNLNHPFKNNMETSFLLCMSDKVLPLIDEKRSILDQDEKFNTYATFSPYSYHEYYNKRVELFLSRYNSESWLSWNYTDWKAYNYFKKQD